MSKNLPNMMQDTIAKIRELGDVNNVIGEPITTPDGVTIIPVSKVSVGFGGGGSDYVKNVGSGEPFGGGVGGGVKGPPGCCLLGADGKVRLMPVAAAANTTADRLVEMIPDTLDKISAFIDSRNQSV